MFSRKKKNCSYNRRKLIFVNSFVRVLLMTLVNVGLNPSKTFLKELYVSIKKHKVI